MCTICLILVSRQAISATITSERSFYSEPGLRPKKHVNQLLKYECIPPINPSTKTIQNDTSSKNNMPDSNARSIEPVLNPRESPTLNPRTPRTPNTNLGNIRYVLSWFLYIPRVVV